MEVALASPSSMPAEGAEPISSDFLSLPRDALAAILKRVEDTAEAGGVNSLLPLRLVCRVLRNAVDCSMTKFACHVKSTQEKDCQILARLCYCFQHVLLRWPGIHDLSLRFDGKADYVGNMLAAAGGSCRGLKTLSLTVGLDDISLENSNVPSLKSIRQWTALRSLSIKGTVSTFNLIEDLSILSSRLEELVLVDTGLKTLKALPTLTALTLEEFQENCSGPSQTFNYVDLSKLPLSTQLLELRLKNVCVGSLLLPPSLTKLYLKSVATMDNFEHQAALPRLTSLTVIKVVCDSIPWLSTSSGIQQLTVKGMEHVGRLPDLCHMSTLKTLTLEVGILVPSISDLTSLSELNIAHRAIKTPGLPLLERLGQLRTLRFRRLRGIGPRIPGLTALLSLQELSVDECQDLEIPMNLPYQLPQLTTLKLVGIKDLFGPPPPAGLVVGLRELQLGQMSKLQLLDLSAFQALTSLQIRGMHHLSSLGGLEKLTALRMLDISNCPDVRTTVLVQSFPKLETLTLGASVVKLP